MKRIQFRFRDVEQLPHLLRVNLRAADVPVSRLILRIDRDRQRLDGVHVDLGHLFRVATALGLGLPQLFEPFFVEAVEEVSERGEQQRENHEGNARVEQEKYQTDHRDCSSEYSESRRVRLQHGVIRARIG
jgi:hypothetical protein